MANAPVSTPLPTTTSTNDRDKIVPSPSAICADPQVADHTEAPLVGISETAQAVHIYQSPVYLATDNDSQNKTTRWVKDSSTIIAIGLQLLRDGCWLVYKSLFLGAAHIQGDTIAELEAFHTAGDLVQSQERFHLYVEDTTTRWNLYSRICALPRRELNISGSFCPCLDRPWSVGQVESIRQHCL